MREFNLIEEPWIRVLDKGCRIKEVGIRETLLSAHEFSGLAGETKTQDFAVLRLLLALAFVIFYRYDIDGNRIDLRENKNAPGYNWKKAWKDGHIPHEPVEKYLAEWHDRFWLFDDVCPFYQMKSLGCKKKNTTSTSQMIGTLSESDNKKRLFADRNGQGRILSYPEAARWLLYINCFDDISARNPAGSLPKRPWVGLLGLIALKGKNLFETIMLNFCVNADIEKNIFDECPSWEQDNDNVDFNRTVLPRDQAALFSMMSRRILLLHSDNNNVENYYLAGGDYFEDTEVFQEQMTLWKAYQENKTKDAQYKYRPARHDPSRKIWQEFGSIVGIDEKDLKNSRCPGVINRMRELREDNVIKRSYVAKVVTAAVIYNEQHKMSYDVIDVISDSLNLHTQILDDKAWYTRIVLEVQKCDSAAYYVSKLYKEIQLAIGRQDKDAKTELSGEIEVKMRFYASIDEPFRLWIEKLRSDDDSDPDDCMAEIEKTLRHIAFDFGNSIAAQAGINAIFGSEKGSSVKALNHYLAVISKIFDKAGD